MDVRYFWVECEYMVECDEGDEAQLLDFEQSLDEGVLGYVYRKNEPVNIGDVNTDFDQRVRPQGSLFVELYNPWTDGESLPGELYQKIGGHTGIDLRTQAPDNDSPVWRMIIVDSTDLDDPDDPENIYDYRDNHALVCLGVPGEPNAVHPLSDPKRFYMNMRSDKVVTESKPYRADSFILISAGPDSRYGTADDICNFDWKYRD